MVAKAHRTDQVEVVDLAHDQEPRKASRGEVADQELRPGGGLHDARSGTRTGAARGAAGRRRVSPARRCHGHGAGGGVGPCGGIQEPMGWAFLPRAPFGYKTRIEDQVDSLSVGCDFFIFYSFFSQFV